MADGRNQSQEIACTLQLYGNQALRKRTLCIHALCFELETQSIMYRLPMKYPIMVAIF